MAMISDNVARLKEDISMICERLGKGARDITIIGVTKMASVEMMKEAIAAGISCIGENKVQDAARKLPLLSSEKIAKHMIGHLQTNKVKQALELFDMIQSVDSLKLAQEIEKQAAKLSRSVDILIEVNASGEEQKYGVPCADAPSLIKQTASCDHIMIKGLMTMAPFVDDEDIIRSCFRRVKELADTITKQYESNEKVQMQYLSMGMTADYRIALEEGSNMVRIGRALFNNG